MHIYTGFHFRFDTPWVSPNQGFKVGEYNMCTMYIYKLWGYLPITDYIQESLCTITFSTCRDADTLCARATPLGPVLLCEGECCSL